MISHFLCGLDGITTKAVFQLFLMLLNGYAETPPDSYKAITMLRIQILQGYHWRALYSLITPSSGTST